MSQVLKYGVPVKEGLLCDNPACKELATIIIKMLGGRKHSDREAFACSSEHLPALVVSGVTVRLIKLATPGERNPKEDTAK